MFFNILLTLAEGIDLVLSSSSSLLGSEFDVGLSVTKTCQNDLKRYQERRKTHPLLFPLTLCSEKVISFSSSSTIA